MAIKSKKMPDFLIISYEGLNVRLFAAILNGFLFYGSPVFNGKR